ncbi:MAG: DnaA/Hda family protein, partial [Eubacteriales bacterium]|nr:DnaA/Hda family protein [Eubacteriales bacterium]
MDKQSAAALWEKAATLLKQQIDPFQYQTWFANVSAVDFDGSTLTLVIDYPFNQSIILQRYSMVLTSALSQVAGGEINWKLLVRSDLNEQSAPTPSPAPQQPVNSSSFLNPRYTFDNYVIGKSNNFAQAAASAVSKNPGTTYNPLFLYSGVGLGKTHLMHAIGHYIQQEYPDKHIVYITSENFTNEFIASIQTGK